MNTKQIGRWVIVLFLLAALPGLTAVMAQQEPLVDTPAYPWPPGWPNVYESEPNDSLATADVVVLGDMMGGSDDIACTDVDYYRLDMPRRGHVLIESHNAFNRVAILKPDGSVLKEVEAEQWLFYSLYAGTYYIRLTPYHWTPFFDCGSDYRLIVMSPLIISGAAANLSPGRVDDLRFYSQDILFHADLNNGEEWWEILINGSDIGITKNNVTNIAAHGGDELLFSVAASQTLPGVGTVTPWDIFIYDPTYIKMGDTQGTFRWGLQGAQHGLTTSTEKLDAIEGFTEGIRSNPAYQGCFGFPVSTVGVATVDGPFGPMKQDDEDIFCKVYNPDAGGWQHWDWFFDVNGKFDRPVTETPPGTVRGLPVEDVTAMAYDDDRDVIYLTIQGSGTVLGHVVTQKDIFALNYPSYTWAGIVWHGPDHGWNYNIDAFDWGVQ